MSSGRTSPNWSMCRNYNCSELIMCNHISRSKNFNCCWNRITSIHDVYLFSMDTFGHSARQCSTHRRRRKRFIQNHLFLTLLLLNFIYILNIHHFSSFFVFNFCLGKLLQSKWWQKCRTWSVRNESETKDTHTWLRFNCFLSQWENKTQIP